MVNALYKNLTEKRKLIKSYIKNNPEATYRGIRKNTKLKIERVYKNMKEAYNDANVTFSKNLTKRNKEIQKKEVIDFIQKHPKCTVLDIQNKTRVSIPRTFGSILNAYKMAGINYPIREINSGVRNPFVIKRCKSFERKIINLLGNLGEVESQVKISGGIIDCLFNYRGSLFTVEIKDFRGKNNITMHEIKQLVKYMKAINCKNGLLICPKESFPKRKNRRNIYIDDLNIKILSEEDLRGHRLVGN